MKRQKLFAILTAVALIFTSFGCKNDDESDGSGDLSQPEYVGKIYSAKDGKTWLKIDSKDEATLAVWEDGSATQSASRAATASSGSYVFRQGKYTISIKDGKDIFSLKLEWTANGKAILTRLSQILRTAQLLPISKSTERAWTGNRKQRNLQSLLKIVLAAEEILLEKLAVLQAAEAKAVEVPAAILLKKNLITAMFLFRKALLEFPACQSKAMKLGLLNQRFCKQP